MFDKNKLFVDDEKKNTSHFPPAWWDGKCVLGGAGWFVHIMWVRRDGEIRRGCISVSEHVGRLGMSLKMGRPDSGEQLC